ncbi:L-type lectin-domain containing receptor kinase IV.2-like [Phalaenopsis equestris]|uniref:L-type lectin-domain containing receptor kinase IV.2-like n=1 Tax=Phalaenopsis equestris TaxID=78828 RepID=UPI0009E53FCC|nr:L-type lectin-domain containing receptor kinase IV.2-like [Phalaenopsis equestris]
MASLLFLLLIIKTSAAENDDFFFYNGFSSEDLLLDGIAGIAPNGLLILTNTSKYMQSHAFHKRVIRFKNASDGRLNSFSTCFAFAIVSEYSDVGGHGLALVISPTRGRTGAFPVQFLGLFNSSNNGNSSNHAVAVELDTLSNVEFEDINNNHVGVDINGLRSVAAAPASYFLGENEGYDNLTLLSGKPMMVWVEYDGQDMKLNVTICPINVPKPSIPLISLSLNLSLIIYDTMYIGFSSSSGSIKTSHYVLGWSFKLNGQARRLNLITLPSLPAPIRRKSKAVHDKLYILAVVLMLVTAMGIAYVVAKRIIYAEVVEEWEVEFQHQRLSYKDLYKATKGFGKDELLGIGGFGRVYKGKLTMSTTTEIAVKRISRDLSKEMREIVSEIVSIGQLRHPNLVQLLGYCRRKGELLLVYEFMSNGSLDKFIFDDTGKKKLNWAHRFQIIKGVASALFYLHEEWEKVVIHRDIKSSNILLDDGFNAKVGDFGISRLYDHGSDPNTTNVIGTIGYIAPELSKNGRITTSTDVYAFGVFLLEVACGRRPILQEASSDVLNLVDWVSKNWKRGIILESRDVKLGNDFKSEEIELVLRLGLLCSHPLHNLRPSMRQVVQILTADGAQQLQVFMTEQEENLYGSGRICDLSAATYTSPQQSESSKLFMNS